VQPPHDPTRQLKPDPARHKFGVITGFSKLSTSKNQSVYEVVLESRLALLRNTPKVRFFFDKSEPEVMQQLLKEHGFNKIWARVEMNLYRTYRKRRIITQWHESDLDFLKRLCERTGIWFVCEEGEDCEVVRFGDDLTHYRRDTERENRPFELPLRPESGMDTQGTESVKSLEMHAVSIPTTYHVRSYNYRQAPYPIEATEQIFAKDDDTSTYGEASKASLAIETKADAQREALLRREAAEAAQIEYRGTSEALDVTPGTVIAFTDHTLADAKYGLLIVSMKCSASRKQGYKVELTAIPSDRLYRMPLRESEWPRIEGTITGTIASTPGFSGPYIDGHGEYIVQFHDDREQRVAGLNSCLLRLAKPFAGKWQTGFHMPYLPGSEVAIAFFAGNPDLPYILHALHNSLDTDPVHQEHKWRTRNVVIHTVRNNTIQVEDRENQEHIKIATEPGKSQLNLGHAVSSGDQLRGLGFELRSDAKGALRAGQGLLISTEPQNKAQGQITDTSGATALFERTQAQADALAQGAVASKAEVADLKAENQWLKDELADIKKQVIALSAPHGIGLATPDRVMIGAGKDVSVVTSRGSNVSAFENVAIAAREVLSLFANTMGIRMFAGKGPIEIQAQSDVLALAAQKDVIVTSANGAVHVRADKELVLECGGAYVELKDGTITLGSAKPLQLKLPGLRTSAAEIMHLAGPAFAPVVVPFRTSCDAWLYSDSFAEKTTPSGSKQVNWERPQSASAVPAALASQAMPDPVASDPVPAGASATDQPSTDAPEADHDSKHELKRSPKPRDQDPEPEPIKIGKPVWCDWKLKNMKKECTASTETKTYKALTKFKTPWLDKRQNQIMGGGSFPTAFELNYDAENQILTAVVRIKIIPVDLVQADSSGNALLDAAGKMQSVAYHHDFHWPGIANGVDSPISGGLLMKYRDGTGPNFDITTKSRAVENTLNTHGSLLILDGCSKGAACGCRVKVRFKVDMLLSIRNANVGDIHKEINLFPQAKRADSGSWGEENLIPVAGQLNQFVTMGANNVVAHECGHLFNFPDEYWEYGGFVHETYVQNEELDFAFGTQMTGKDVWQIRSENNLMGYGANNAAASVSHYYLKYVRRQFSEMTGKTWKIGYEG
jgi:type VI secretion system secreted protein VgrG